MKKKISPECEMCGRPNVAATIKVEGALLRVCSNCTQFGNEVEEKRSSLRGVGSTRSSSRSAKSKSSPSSPRTSQQKKDEADQQILIDGYGNVIKKARMKKRMTQDQLSQKSGVSQAYIRSIENENMRPTDKVARKLEKELGIELFEEPEIQLEHQDKKKSKGLTFGDIAVVKRFEYD